MGSLLRLLLTAWKAVLLAPLLGWIWVFGSFSVFLWCELCRPFFRGSSPEERNLRVAKHEGQMIVVFV